VSRTLSVDGATKGQSVANVSEVKDRVRDLLSDFVEGDLAVDDRGAFTFRFDSAQVYVDVAETDLDSTVVRIVAPLMFAVPASEELFRWVATHNVYDYGHMRAIGSGSGDVRDAVDLVFQHSLLGDYLDPEELAQAVTSLAATADELDDEIKGRFGGSRFHEDAAWGRPLS